MKVFNGIMQAFAALVVCGILLLVIIVGGFAGFMEVADYYDAKRHDKACAERGYPDGCTYAQAYESRDPPAEPKPLTDDELEEAIYGGKK